MKPSKLFNYEDETKELICGQSTKQLRNNTCKGEEQETTMQFRDKNWKEEN